MIGRARANLIAINLNKIKKKKVAKFVVVFIRQWPVISDLFWHLLCFELIWFGFIKYIVRAVVWLGLIWFHSVSTSNQNQVLIKFGLVWFDLALCTYCKPNFRSVYREIAIHIAHPHILGLLSIYPILLIS